jgi:hypothetical protein
LSKINGHEARINNVLAVAYQRGGRESITRATPATMAELFEIAELADRAAEDDEAGEKTLSEGAIRMLQFAFAEGGHPGCVLRRVYMLAQRLSPALVANMNGAELGDIFGETRAAWSARIQRVFTGYLKARGSKAPNGRMQKSATAAARYAAAATGNTNRRGKFKLLP